MSRERTQGTALKAVNESVCYCMELQALKKCPVGSLKIKEQLVMLPCSFIAAAWK